MGRVIGYGRVSTASNDQAQALERQIDRLKSAGAEEVFVDVESGAKDDRKNFLHILELVRDHRVDEVIVTEQARLGRSILAIQRVIETFLKANVNLRVLDGSVDLSTAAGRMQVNVMAAVAQHERERIVERVLTGWSYTRKMVKPVNPPFGYYVLENKFHLDRRPVDFADYTRADVARELVEGFLEHKSLRGTLKAFGNRYQELRATIGPIKSIPKSVSGLRDWINNPVLRGHTRYKPRGANVTNNRIKDVADRGEPIIHYNTHPDQIIISPDEYREIEAILEFNHQYHGFVTSFEQKYALSGLVKCGKCGGNCNVIGNSRAGGKYYQCNASKLTNVEDWESHLHRKAVHASVLEAAVIKALVERAEEINEIAQTLPDKIEPKELLEMREKLEGLEKLPFDLDIEEAKLKLRSRMENLKHELKEETESKSSNRSLLSAFNDPNFWHTIDIDRKVTIFRGLISRVVIAKGDILRIELRV